MQFPLHDGTQTTLEDLAKDRGAALVFLRHFGCLFCRYQVAQLRPAKDLPIVFVCMESPEEAAAFRAKLRSPHPFLSDPQRVLHERFGVKRGTGRQLVNLNSFKQGLRAMGSGSFQGKVTSDPMQLSAAVVLDREGKPTWSHLAVEAGDIVSPETLREKLARFAQ